MKFLAHSLHAPTIEALEQCERDTIVAMILAHDPDAVSSDDALAFTTTSHVDRVSPDALDLTCDWYQEHADILEAYTDLDRDYVPIHTLCERWTYDE